LHKYNESNKKAEVEGIDTECADKNVEVNSTQKIKQLEEELLSQNSTLSKQKEIEAKLTVENGIVKEQLEKLKRVVTNMSKEINNLKSTRS
jgi:dynactin complex subunit